MIFLTVGTLAGVLSTYCNPVVTVGLQMNKASPHVIVPTKERSELQQFAGWFSQDCGLFFSDFYQGAAQYIAALPAPRREILRLELRQFLDDNPKSSSKELVRQWIKLGAQTWDRGLEIRPALEDFHFMLDSNYDLSFVNKGRLK